MVTAIVILLGVAYATTQIDGAASAGDDGSSPSPSGGKVPALLALSVTGAPKPLLALIVPLEILGQFMRLISLSVRLFANMLAGHILILTFVGLLFILQQVFLAVIVIPVAILFYIFEVVIVVSIQAFIFAALSAIYIGSAIEPQH